MSTTAPSPAPPRASTAAPPVVSHEVSADAARLGTSQGLAGPLAQSHRHVPRQLAAPVVWGRAPKLSVRLVLAGLLLAGLAVAATWRAWVDAWSLADVEGDNSHVFLAPLVVLWLIWVRRGRLAYIRVSGRWAGPVLITGGWALSAFGLANNVAAAFHLGSLGIVVGAFVSVVGKGVITRMMPVAFALLFLIPVPQLIRQRLAIPLQTSTAVITDGILDAFGVDSQVSGNTLLVNGKHVMIAEACNGMPMVFGLLLVTYAFAFAWPMRNSVRWLLLILSPIVTLSCNVLRTTPLVWTYATRSRELADWLHTWSGWIMLPVGFVVLLLVIRALRWFDVPVERYRLAAQ